MAQASSTMTLPTPAAVEPSTVSPPRPSSPAPQPERVPKPGLRKVRGRLEDLRRLVLIKNSWKSWQARQQRRKQRRAVKAAKTAKAAATASSAAAAETSPCHSAQPSSPTPSHLPPVTPVVNSPDLPPTPSSSEAKDLVACTITEPTAPVVFGMSDDMQLDLKHDQGDVIETASENSVIVHACNCLGAWGSGIALQLKKQFPAAFKVYAQTCTDNDPTDLFGTCLLIAPQAADYSPTATTRQTSATAKKPVWIACLFTSVGWGKGNKRTGNPGVSSKDDILKATSTSLMSLLLEWRDARGEEEEDSRGDEEEDSRGEEEEDSGDDKNDLRKPGDIFCPRFNAGSFGVPWEGTEELILQKWSSVPVVWTVVSN